MSARRFKSLLSAGALGALLLAPSTIDPVHAQGRGRLKPLVSGQALRRPAPRGEAAYTRGYADGYEHGLADGRRRQRYDPVESREYRDGDGGYTESYGSRDAYRNNYRAGFRQGYENGYRDGTR